jgi:hypothetical protein
MNFCEYFWPRARTWSPMSATSYWHQLIRNLAVSYERRFAHELFFQRYLLQFHPVHTSKSRAGKASGRKYAGFHTCYALRIKSIMSSRECSSKAVLTMKLLRVFRRRHDNDGELRNQRLSKRPGDKKSQAGRQG